MGAEQSSDANQNAAGTAPLVDKALPTQPASGPSVLVISGPSGVGKGTLIKRLMDESDQFAFCVSHTSRAPREGEKNGNHYHFVTKEEFMAGEEQGAFIEYAEYANNYYGTSLAAVEDVIKTGKCCVLDIDVQGARSLRASGVVRGVFVFVAPPSLEELERRLRSRNSDSEESIQLRVKTARQEINSLNEKGLFDYLLINDEIEETYGKFKKIAERALAGLDPEPGMVPDRVTVEEDDNGAEVSAADGEAGHSHLPSLDKWVGKVALVTGASSGIGWATCEALALAGMRVVAVARRRERLEQLQQHIIAAGVPASDFLPVVCDITKDAEVAALPRIVSKRWPECGIDVLVNNAGLSRNDASLFDGNTASWVEMISTNVLGLCMCTREVIQDMKRRNSWGHIINMVGLSGHRIPDGPQGGTFYSSTKHAVRAITEGLRQEARGKGVPLRVSGISPGVVETEFFAVRAFGDADSARKVTSNMRCLQPEDIAAAVMWCLSAPDHAEVNDIVIRPTQQMI